MRVTTKTLPTAQSPFACPTVGISVSRFFPFKRKVKVGKDKWFEKIGMNYTGNAKNQVKVKEENPLKAEYFRQHAERNESQHSNQYLHLKLLKYFSVNPSVNLKGVMQFQSLEQRWDEAAGEVVKDTVSGFAGYGDVSFSSGLSTIIYGMYSFKKGKVKSDPTCTYPLCELHL